MEFTIAISGYHLGPVASVILGFWPDLSRATSLLGFYAWQKNWSYSTVTSPV